MTKTATFRTFDDEKITVSVGDVVGFKCDVEQYGEVIAIRRRDRFSFELTLRGEFYGEYLEGQTKTVVHGGDVWLPR